MITVLPSEIPTDVEDRFWEKVHICGNDDCWIWRAATTKAGYGRFQYLGRSWYSTHISLTLDGRPRKCKYQALHSCDNPSCVNPKHLRWGSHGENMADKIIRGRCARLVGVDNPMAMPVNEGTIEKKHYICTSNKSDRVLAAELGVGPTIINSIRNGRKWRHVPFERGEHLK